MAAKHPHPPPPARKKTTAAGKRTARKRTIAAGKALGKRHKTIAEEAGVAVRTVEDFGKVGPKAEAEAAMIHEFGQRHEAKLDQLYAEAIESCRRDFSDELGSVRATARGQAIAMIQASDKYRRPPAEAEDASQGQYTLTELLVSFHKQQIQGGDG